MLMSCKFVMCEQFCANGLIWGVCKLMIGGVRFKSICSYFVSLCKRHIFEMIKFSKKKGASQRLPLL